MIYLYARDKLATGSWDIDHPDRLTYLAKEVELAFPGKNFVVVCSGPVARVIFGTSLDSVQETQLNIVVADHKANVI